MKEKILPIIAVTWKQCEIECKFVAYGLLIGSDIGELE